MTSVLPLEVIEGIIGHLWTAPDALQQCSLICRQLLPASRVHLWRSVRLEVTERGLQSPRMESFLELLDDSPTIAWCVRRVLVQYQDDNLAGDATVPNFACNLLHFGISVHEILPLEDVYEGGREHTRRVFSQLHQCQSLRSLELQCDCSSFFWIQSNGLSAHQTSFRLPSFAIAELADTLSSPGAPPCPLLESISIEVIAPQGWLVGWGKDVALLASVISGSDEEGRKRYPRFTRFHFRSAVLDLIRPGMGQSAMDYAQLQREVKKEDFLMPMLEPFCRAGLDVDVDVC